MTTGRFVPILDTASAVALKPLSIDGQFFRQGDERITIIEATDFSLFKLYLDDPSSVKSIIRQRLDCGFNTLRVWLLNRSVVVNGGIHPRDYPGTFYPMLAEFVRRFSMINFELTIFTSTQGLMPNRNDQQAHMDQTADAVRGCGNVLLEQVNEMYAWDNACYPDLTRPSGVLISRGSDGADARPPFHDNPWDYELYHIIGNEWQRKVGHNSMEWADQSGRPCITNETQRYLDRDSNLIHAYDAAAGASLLCAGGCYHSQRGKTSQLWDGLELECAQAWCDGAHSVPLEFQAGVYHHRTELEGPGIIRAYDRQLPDGRAYIVEIRA